MKEHYSLCSPSNHLTLSNEKDCLILTGLFLGHTKTKLLLKIQWWISPLANLLFVLGKHLGMQMKIYFHVEEITGRGLEFVHICSPAVTFQYVMDNNRNKII